MGIINRVRVVPVFLALALAGCGDDKIGPVSLSCGLLGTSSGTVSGTVTANLNGCSYYGVSSGTTVVGLTSGSAASPTHSLALTRQGGRPVNGTYTIGLAAANFQGAFTFDGGTSADRTFVLTSGTVTVSSSSSGTLNGTLTSVVATETTVAAPTINISGSFTSKCTPSGSVTC